MNQNTVHNANLDGNSSLHVGDIHYNDAPSGEELNNTYLASLRNHHLTDPREDRNDIEQRKGGLVRGSYIWIYDDAGFKNWCNNKNCGLLWIKGDPGKGKTMLMCGIIRDITPYSKLPDPKYDIARDIETSSKLLKCGIIRDTEPFSKLPGPQNELALSYSFCQGGDVRRKNAAAVFRGLIYLLAQQHPFLLTCIKEKEHGSKGIKSERLDSATYLAEILREGLCSKALPNTYLIIDALDECTPKDREIIIDFVTSEFSSRVKWLITSRNELDINQRVSTTENKVIVSLDLNKSVTEGVRIFIQHKMDHLATLSNFNDSIRSDVESTISLKAEGTFLCVSLMFQELQGQQPYDFQDLVKRFPQGLKDLYADMMQRLQVKPRFALYLQILALLVTVYRPLSVREITCFEAISQHTECIPDILRDCASFLVVYEGKINFVHQSAREYLTQNCHELFPHGTWRQHLDIFDKSCIKMNTLKQDIYSLGHPAASVYDIDQGTDDGPLAEIEYACVYWIDHLCVWANNTDIESHAENKSQLADGGPLHLFLLDKLLYWVEALSCLGKISNGISSLLQLQNILMKPSLLQISKNTLEFVQDARRFILYFRSCIEHYPLQIYASGLVFSPTESIIRRQFELRDSPQWITQKPEVYSSWSPVIHVFDTIDEVCSIVFKPDKGMAMLDTAGNVTLWDLNDGSLLETQLGDGLKSKDLCSNGQHVASIYQDREICVLDYDANVKWAREINHDTEVKAVCISPNGEWLALFHTHVMDLWHVKGNTCNTFPITFKVSEYGDRRHFFSSNSRLLAIPSDDGIILLDITKGEQQIWSPPDGRVFAIGFWPNSNRLALVGSQNICWLWDTAKKTQCQWIKVEEAISGLDHITFSSTGQWVAIGNILGIWLYHTDTASKVGMVPTGSGLASMAFSQDEQHLLAAFRNRSVVVLDLSQVTAQSRSFSGPGPSGLISSSSDEVNLIAFFVGSHIQLHDAQTGHAVQILEASSGNINRIAFSPNGKILACNSNSGIIDVWDTSGTSASISKITSIVDPENGHSVAVSSNGILAAASYHLGGQLTAKINLWNIFTGKILCTAQIRGGFRRERAFHLALSSNGEWLAASHYNQVFLCETASREIKTIRESRCSYDIGLDISLVFSPNNIWLAVAGQSGVTVIHVKTGIITQVYKHTGHPVKFVDDYIISTKVGIFYLDSTDASMESMDSAQTPVELSCCGFDFNEDWITWNGLGVLWVPSEYLPHETYITVKSDGVAWLSNPDRIMFLNLLPENMF